MSLNYLGQGIEYEDPVSTLLSSNNNTGLKNSLHIACKPCNSNGETDK